MEGEFVLYRLPPRALAGGGVEKLWMTRAKAVENRTAKFILARGANDPHDFVLWTVPSRVASLDRRPEANKIVAARNPFGQTHT